MQGRFVHLITTPFELIQQLRLVRQYPRLEVPSERTFHSDARSCQIGGTDVCHLVVEDHHLEMHPRTKHPFQFGEQNGVTVEILPGG